MITFLKANMSSLLASGCDFLMTVALVQWAGWHAVIAGATGTVTGGVINFCVNRRWVFGAGEERAVRQGFKYALVWAGNLLLNMGGMYVLASYAGLHYVLAKVATSLLVAFLYNYPMQKNFVFSNNW
ncbi:GtrA family protein [Paraflavitalea pollutisoli]|uniref:GtrA family protein n=1 Tax=Paraflavitalea pollutisoli TaxID=3034143 RepID=UPI0023ED8235|nr:GtrA family protein [Paraflavitalea sp. H1-2-19X]